MTDFQGQRAPDDQAGENEPLVAVLMRPLDRFFQMDSAAGLLLMGATAVAMLWANSPWSADYFALWQVKFSVGLGPWQLNKALLLWINDGLMAVFFFLVGLEIKREVLAGKLSSPRAALLPIAAALGGMLVPALLFLAFNRSGPPAAGWGIPMATDIAFALGIMALLGKRVPIALKVFLTALAIVDDIGAVLVIALFYSSDISLLNLAIGGAFLLAMFGASALGVRSPVLYALLGVGGLWFSFLLSGVHATIAGVLAALAIPATVRIPSGRFVQLLRAGLDRFQKEESPGHMLNHAEQDTIAAIETACENVQPPLQRLEHRLYPVVMYAIMPLFALANAGLAFSGATLAGPAGAVSLGIFVGLLVGKLVGVCGFSFVAIRLGWASMPAGSGWAQMVGAGLLAGVGFTMSLFIGGLAFRDPVLVDAGKLGVFAASVVAGIAGYAVLRAFGSAESAEQP